MKSVYAESTVLELGARGKARGRGAFTLAGRVVVRSEAGAVWNEWTLAFADGREAYLAEARGTFTLYEESASAPPWDALRAGETVPSDLVVVERGTARRVATFGEASATPKSYRYADLARAGETVTFDYGEPDRVRVFRGRAHRLAELGLRPRAERPRFLPVTGFPASPPKSTELWLALGDEGVLDGTRWRVIAILARSVREDGERYGWEEYLLHDPAEGFRWLVVSDGHWSFVESVDPSAVRETEKGAVHEGELHKPLSEGAARLDWATGELPWEVSPGDVSRTRDYVKAPHLLSREWSEDEVSWSRASYLPTAVLAKAFAKRALPKPRGRAPHAPKT